MHNQRGFVGVGVLLTIILGVIVLGGGAYFVMHQQSAPQTTSDNFDNVQTLSTNTQTQQPAQPTTNTPKQTTQSSGGSASANTESKSSFSSTPASGSAPLTVNFSGTFDTKVTGDARGNYIDFGDAGPNCNSSGDPCLSSSAVTNPSCATNGICTITGISHTYQTPGTYIAKLMNNNRKKVDDGTIQGKIVGSVIEIAETKIMVTGATNNVTTTNPPANTSSDDVAFLQLRACDNAGTDAQLCNATYSIDVGGTTESHTFANGKDVDGSSTSIHTINYLDIDGEGVKEALVSIVWNGGGTLNVSSVAVVKNTNGAEKQIGLMNVPGVVKSVAKEGNNVAVISLTVEKKVSAGIANVYDVTYKSTFQYQTGVFATAKLSEVEISRQPQQ